MSGQLRGKTTARSNQGSFAPNFQGSNGGLVLDHPMSTLTADDFLTDDELEFARETLGSDASEAEVEELARERAQAAHAEYAGELPERFPDPDPLAGLELPPDPGAVRFFYDNAGWSHGIDEDPEAGHRRSARDLATAERLAQEADAEYTWSLDPQDPLTWVAAMHCDGEHVSSLGGIDAATSENQRVVEAELALEGAAGLRSKLRDDGQLCSECDAYLHSDGYDGLCGSCADLAAADACPACGEPIDYCQGHGEIGDPEGFRVLQRHDLGDHSGCQLDCL